MSIKILCPGCQQSLKIKETLAGKTIRCPSCQAHCRVPAADPPAAPQMTPETVAPPKPEFVKSQIGRFQIRAALGQGGFGTVYRAWDPILNREVALKVPRGAGKAGERLILEARAAAPLHHPNIVAVYEAGADGDDLFIATEYVEGQTLANRISGKSIDASLAAEWVKSLAEALEYAHGEGVVHRDVKPHNIMIGAADRAQLMDFGLAVSRGDEAGSSDTGDSEIAGTPAYMSPEQARGDNQQTGPASDQYSLGAVLYELLTGKTPFRGGKEIVTEIAANAKPSAPRSVVASVPRDLEAICLKAMAPTPGRRYASCRALSEDLSRFLNGELVRARWYSPLELAMYWAKKRPALFGWVTAAVCLLALLIGGGLAMGVRTLMAGEVQSVTGTTGTPGETASTQSTSTNIGVVSDLDAETLLYGRQLDRTRMAFEQDDVIQADQVLEQSRWDFRNWEYNYLRRIVNGGWKTLHGHWSEITAITIHPDGKHFASAGYDNNVRVWEIASGEPVQTLNCNRLVTSLAYSPDGSLLAAATGNSSERPTRPEYGISQEAMMATPAPVAPGSSIPAPVSTPGAVGTATATPAVAMPVLAQPGPNEHAVILLDSQTLEQVALYSEHSGPIASIAFSSDGQLIASGGSDPNPAGPAQAGQSNPPPVGSVRIWNVKTLETERELASPSGPIRRLAFIPGSQRIVATTGQRNYGDVVVWNLDPSAASNNPSAMPVPSPTPMPPIETVPAPPAADPRIPATQASADNKDEPMSLPAETRLVSKGTSAQLASDLTPIFVSSTAIQEPQPPQPPAAPQQASPPQPAAPQEAQLPRVQLVNTEVRDNALYLNGKPEHGPPGGHRAVFRTPELEYSGFTVALRFQFDAASPAEVNLITGGEAGRWFGMHRAENGKLTITLNNGDWKHEVPAGDIVSGEWTAVVCGVSLENHRLVTWLDGKKVVDETLPSEFRFAVADTNYTATDKLWTFTNNSNARSCHGLIDELIVYGRFLSDEEFAAVRLDAEAGANPQPGPDEIAHYQFNESVRDLVTGEGSQTSPAALPVAESSGSHPLQPERRYAAGSFALAVSSMNGGQIVAAPAMDLWLLEQARRRIAGIQNVVQEWTIAGAMESTDLHGSPAAVFDMAFSGEANSYGQQSLAVAGGDPLRIHRPGLLTLNNPSYEYGAHVKHRGHRSAITSIAFRGDGKQFITGDADGTLKIWSAEVHPEVIRMPGQQVATRVAFGNDGRYVAVATRNKSWTQVRGAVSMRDGQGNPIPPDKSAPGTIRLQDIRNGNTLLTLSGGPGDILGLAMDPESKWIAGGGEDAHVRVWNLDSGRIRYERETPGIVRCVAVSRDAQMIAASCNAAVGGIQPVPEGEAPAANAPASKQGFVVVWQVSDGKEIARWHAHDGDVLSVAFSPDGLQLATSGSDRSVRVWTLSDTKLAFSAAAYDGEIIDLAFRSSGEDLAGVGFDPCRPDKAGDIIVWSLTDGQRRLTLPGISGRMYGVAYTPDGRRFATGGGSYEGSVATPGDVRVWDAETGIELLPLIGRPGRSEKKETVCVTVCVPVTKTVNETVYQTVEEQVPETKTRTIKFPVKSIGDDGKEVTTYEEKTETFTQMRTVTKQVPVTVCKPVTVNEMRTEKRSSEVTWEEPGTVLGIAFSGDGRSLAAACEDGSALVWDAANCQPHDAVTWTDGRLLCTAASSDGQLIATGGDMGSGCECAGLIRIYDASTGRLTREIETAAGAVTSIAFTPDSQNVVIAAGCNSWQLGSSCSIVGDHVPMSQDLANQFSAARNTIDLRSHCEVWNVETGTRVIEIGEPEEFISQIAVHPIDGRVLITAGKVIRLHDGTTGNELRRWTMNSYTVSLSVIPNGHRFAVSTGDGTVLMGNLDSDEPPKLVAEKLSHSLLTFDAGAAQLAAVETIWSAGQGMNMPVPQQLQIPQERPAPSVKPESVSTRQLHLWNVESPDTHRVMPLTSTHTPSGVAWDSTLKSCVIGGEDGSVVLVNPDDGSQSLRMTGQRDATRVLTLPDGRFVSFGSENKLHVWRFQPAEQQTPDCVECTIPRSRTLTLATDPRASVTKVQFSGDGRLAAVSGNRPVVLPPASPQVPRQMKWEAVFSLHDPSNGHLVDTVVVPDVTPRDFALSSNGRYLAAYRQDGVALIWDREQNKVIAECSEHQGPILDIAFHPDGDRIATAGQDGSVRIWSLDGKELAAIPQDGRVSCLTFSPDGQMLAAGVGRTVAIWSVNDQRRLQTLNGHYGELCDLSFCRDGQLIATTSRTYVNDRWTGDLKVWQVATGVRTLSIPAHTWSNVGVAFHPTLPHIAITGKEHTLMMYHSETGALLLSIPTGGYECGSVAFSPDGTRLLAPLANRATLIDPTPEITAFGNGAPHRQPQDPTEEAAAKWVLEQGGQVQVIVDQIVPFDVNQAADLPTDPYTVSRISLAGKDGIQDADLTVLHALRNLTAARLDLKSLTNAGLAFLGQHPDLQEIYVNGTHLTDKGLQNFGSLKRLKVLHVNDTRVAGAGAMFLKECKVLESLEMHRTLVDDVSVVWLGGLQGLKNLGLAGTKVTDEGITRLKKEKPDLNIGR